MSKTDDDPSYGILFIVFTAIVFFCSMFIYEQNAAFFKILKVSQTAFALTATGIFVCMFTSWMVLLISARNRRIAKETEASIIRGEIAKEREKLSEEKKLVEAAQQIFKEKTKGFPFVAKAYADYLTFSDEIDAEILVAKSHPALVAADKVREIARSKRELAAKLKVAEYQLAYYEELFPWLTEFRDIEDDDLIQIQAHNDPEQEEDSARRWLTAKEYDSLPTTDRYQIALDRYLKGKKTKWQIGRDYERFVGYLYEQKGYTVKFHGIIEGYEDLGRDLICTKGNEVCIVQCKYWSSYKTIHEKHINQLFGTAIVYVVQKIDKLTKQKISQAPQIIEIMKKHQIKAVLVTSTDVSETAKHFADVLGVEIQDKFKMEQYPLIKCNINPSSGEKIYHLPFDQQYDRVLCVNKGECYVSTIKEAEKLGFRRAMRWRGNA